MATPEDKTERLRALISMGCSITNFSFTAARRFLMARHGANTFIPPRVLYYEADNLFLAARKLAKEIGDKRKEAEVLYHWALLQLRPPIKSIMFVAPRAGRTPTDLALSDGAKTAGERESPDKLPVPSIPDLALAFFLEAIPLAEETGLDTVAVASLFYSARIFRDRGDTAKYQAQVENLRQKTSRIAKSTTPLPQWLLEEVKTELG